ncbi:MAG: peptidoglycan DD-metalloendopeptidase family protein [Lachnospiraceae bacterium]|nr:peptidoglycan DD-metalloendopeptidase family protein [Lachnospiraceae bacterium]
MILCLSLILFIPPLRSRADKSTNTDDLKERISQKEGELSGLEQEKKELQQGKRNVQNVINALEGKKKEMSDYVTELDSEVSSIQSDIDALMQKIEIKEQEIEETRVELAEAEAETLRQYEAMKERICFMYETGDSFYLEMLLSAGSFSEMLNKAEYIELISEYDRNKLVEYTLLAEDVRVTGEVLEAEEEVLQEAKAQAEQQQEDLNLLIAEKKQQIEQYEADIEDQEAAIAAYDEELKAQNQVIAAVEAQIAADKASLAEAEKIHYNGGRFVWPAPKYTRISSPFGYRIHPTLNTKKLHSGVDLAAPGGSPILAAYDGKVVAAAYNASMGNYVMIDHGDNLITVYMHASALYVKTGQTVSAGEKIAAVGTTGRSTGNHLHFGVRLNGEYVDPMPYIS